MIYEYALEPELVATWRDRKSSRYFVENFGVGKGRIVSRYPKPWKRLVWEAFQSADDIERARMVELIVRLSERMVKRRDYYWSNEKTWLDNAEVEHQKVPFRAILARSNPNNNGDILVADELDESSAPLWATPTGLAIPRKADAMATAASPMLHCCSVVVFIDPHFMPDNIEYRSPLQLFLVELLNARPSVLPPRVEIHTNADKCEASYFRECCEEKLPAIIPNGMVVRFVRWKERDGGQKLHNRYILTDLGGIDFDHGLDEGDTGETDDMNLLDQQQYALRWSQYVGENPAFDLEGAPFNVVGQSG